MTRGALARPSPAKTKGAAAWESRSAWKHQGLNIDTIASPGTSPKMIATELAFTVVESDQSLLTKTYDVGPDGQPRKCKDAGLSAGRALRATLRGTAGEIAQQLADRLASINQKQAIILAPPPVGRDAWPLVRKEEVRPEAGEIARTRDFFKRPDGAGLVVLDFDGKSFPADILSRLADAGGVSGVLAAVSPAFATAARVSRASVSVGIRNKESGVETDGNSGRHHYFIAADAADAPRFGEVLRDRLTLAGWSWGEISKSGAVLFRSLIDAAVTTDGARLVYEADAILADDRLEHVEGARTPDTRGGGMLDTRTLPDLTPQESAKLERIKATIRADLQEASAAARAAWMQERGEELVARGVAAPAAERALAAACESRVLSGDYPIQLDSGDVVTVQEILTAKDRYHKATCADPLEPDYGGGRDKAIIYTDGTPHIYSHAHGGANYALRPDAEAFFAASVDDEPSGWPEPVDLFGDGDSSTLMDVPAGALPDCIEGFVRDEAERMGAPEAFLAIGAIITASAAIGGQMRLQPKAQDTRWTVPPFLWGVIVEPPGGRKSPVISSAIAPLGRVDSRWAAADIPKRQAWEIESKKRKKDASAPTARPRLRRAVVDSFTVESARDVLADNPRGVLVSADELSGLISGLDQYKSAGGSDRADLLKLMDGAPRSFDRVGRSYRIECWGAAVLGGIQPKRLAEISRKLDPDGLLQRFLPIVGDGESRRGVDRPPDAAAVAAYEAAIIGLADAQHGGFFEAAPVVTLSPEAQAIRQGFECVITNLQDLPQMSEAWRGHLAKWDGFFARLLLVFHMLSVPGREAVITPVSGATAERARRFANFLLAHAMRFYESVVGIGEGGEAARQAAGIILVLNKSVVTRRALYEKHRAWRPDGEAPRELLDAMRILSRLGWCEPAERDDTGPTSWSLNPKVFELFSDRAAAETERRRRGYARVQAAVAEHRKVKSAVAAPIAPCEAAGVFA